MPYALSVVVKVSTAVSMSVNPAFASVFASDTKVTASAVSCPAEIAEYAASEISEALTPV